MAIFEQGKPELRLERFHFKGVVQQIINSMRLQFEKYQANVTFTSEGDHFDIHGDAAHLTSVVYNIMR